MLSFPGSVLIIDDKFDIVYDAMPHGADRIEYKSFQKIKNYCDDNGLPLLKITDVSGITTIERKLNKMTNVRLLILDLDLDGDGQVTAADEVLVIAILRIAVKRFGYFFLLINSITPEHWEGIKSNIDANDADLLLLVQNLEDYINKNEDISFTLDNIINKNHSVKLIYSFETALNESRDKALKEFIDYDKETWRSWISILKGESKNLVHYDICSVFLSIIKQYLAGVKFDVRGSTYTSFDTKMIEKIYKNVNYLRNTQRILNRQPIWTGNLYRTNYEKSDKQYALILTPECDIAQNKYVNHKVVFGVEINNTTLANYSVDDQNVPIIATKFPKNKNTGKWQSRSAIKEKIEKQNLINHLFLLPFASENEKTILFDYRNTAALQPSLFKKYQLVLRVNDPLIIEIMDNYSNLYNRKGLITYPYKEFKLLPEDVL